MKLPKITITKTITLLMLVFSILNISCKQDINSDNNSNTSENIDNIFPPIPEKYDDVMTWWLTDDLGTFTKGERLEFHYDKETWQPIDNDYYTEQGYLFYRTDTDLINSCTFSYINFLGIGENKDPSANLVNIEKTKLISGCAGILTWNDDYIILLDTELNSVTVSTNFAKESNLTWSEYYGGFKAFAEDFTLVRTDPRLK